MATIAAADPRTLLGTVSEGLKAGTIVPYLGPGISALSDPEVPMTPEALAAFFEGKTALPKRARGNAWAAAQHIESFRHRQTPIPEDVRRRRTGLSFVFIGCHFHDQLLRTYARQIMKRSAARHYAVVELAGLILAVED